RVIVPRNLIQSVEGSVQGEPARGRHSPGERFHVQERNAGQETAESDSFLPLHEIHTFRRGQPSQPTVTYKKEGDGQHAPCSVVDGVSIQIVASIVTVSEIFVSQRIDVRSQHSPTWECGQHG